MTTLPEQPDPRDDDVAQGLRRLYRPPPPDPARLTALDEVIARAAHGRSTEIRRRRFMLRAAGLGTLAAAAAIAMAVVLWQPGGPPATGISPAPVIAGGNMDINGDGTIDILDALVLSRKIERETASPASHDYTNDGLVTQQDVDRVAAAAVALDEEERS